VVVVISVGTWYLCKKEDSLMFYSLRMDVWGLRFCILPVCKLVLLIIKNFESLVTVKMWKIVHINLNIWCIATEY